VGVDFLFHGAGYQKRNAPTRVKKRHKQIGGRAGVNDLKKRPHREEEGEGRSEKRLPGFMAKIERDWKKKMRRSEIHTMTLGRGGPCCSENWRRELSS